MYANKKRKHLCTIYVQNLLKIFLAKSILLCFQSTYKVIPPLFVLSRHQRAFRSWSGKRLRTPTCSISTKNNILVLLYVAFPRSAIAAILSFWVFYHMKVKMGSNLMFFHSSEGAFYFVWQWWFFCLFVFLLVWEHVHTSLTTPDPCNVRQENKHTSMYTRNEG